MELSVKHEEFRLAYHSDKSVPVFLSYVCNNKVPLPEDGIDGAPMHLPVSWLGMPDPDSRALDMDGRAKRASQAQGWKTGMPYLLVLEGPQAQDFHDGVALSGFAGKFVKEELERAGIPLSQVLVTFGARFAAAFGKKYSDAHFRVGAPYVITDIHKCQPKVIIACGAKVVKSLFNDKTKLASIRGNVVEFSTGKYFARDFKTLVVPTESPASFSMGYGDIEVFRSELRRAREVVEGSYKSTQTVTDYRVIDTVEGVEKLVTELLSNPPRHMAFDTEFGNDVAREEFSYTLSVQLAWGKGKAAYIKLRDQIPQSDLVIEKPIGKPKKDGSQKTKTFVIPQRPKCGVPVFSPEDDKKVWGLLHKLFLDPRIRLDGQHLRVDVQQFYRNDANIDLRIVDGFDTMLVHHILKGDDSQGLDHLVRKYTPHFGAYWYDLDMWKASKDGEGRAVFGYRDVPLDILIPYALKDADATWQVAEELEKELEKQPGLKKYYWEVATWTSLHLLDVERQGILVDDARRMEIREQYLPVYEDLQKRLREAINWPDFEPTSKPKLAYLLFSKWEYKDRDKLKDVVPHDVKLFDLKPLYNTDKHPIQWDDILQSQQYKNNTPCTKAAVLDQLAEENPQHQALLLLKHMSVLGKFLSTYLTPVVLNSFGVPEGGKGFAENIWSDGRVRTRLSMLTETGRYTSGSANLNTNPKKQEDSVLAALIYHKLGISLEEYKKRTFDGDKKKPAYAGPDRIEKPDRVTTHQFKSCMIAREGYVLIEADFKTAELYIWAYASGDPGLLKILGAGRDMHSEGTALLLGAEAVAERDAAIAKLEAGDRDAYDLWCNGIKLLHEALRIGYKSCFAAGSEVLTSRGFIPIEEVKLTDLLWDGTAWVQHEGVIHKGVRQTILREGVWVTPEHKILTIDGWKAATLLTNELAEVETGTYAHTGQMWLDDKYASLEHPPADSTSYEPLPGETVLYKDVYDIVNSGPNHRYQIRDFIAANCIFGIMYGRSAAAVARATGLPLEQCQAIIDSIQEDFPVAWRWLQDNMDKAIRDEKLKIAGGRYRYFSGASKMSKSRQAAMRREASNCGVQGAVSFLLSQAGINFYKAKYLKRLPIDFNILLPIHDAFLFEVKIGDEDKMEKLIKICMSTGNKLPGTTHSLGVDIERYHRWGEKTKH